MIYLRFVIVFALLQFSINTVTAQDLDLVVPVLVGQTGASASFGRNETDAYTMAAEEWNARGGVDGKRVVLQLEDTTTSAKQILSAFHLHASRGVKVILGPTWLDGFPAVIPVARKTGVLLVTPSAAIEAFSASDRTWPVTFYHNSTSEIRALVEALRSKGFGRLALVYEQEPFAEMIRKLLVANGVSLMADIGVQAGETDFKAPLARLRDQRLDALIVFVWDERSLLALLQQIRSSLPSVLLATVHDGAGWLTNPVFSPLLPRLTYTQFIMSDTSFEKRFKERFGYAPILTASNAYDALNSVLTALAAGANSGSTCRDYLMNHELDSVTFGRFRFHKDGSVPSKVELVDHRADGR